MMEKKLLLVITHFQSQEGKESYVERENLIRNCLPDCRIRFFHRKFQSKNLTLTRIMKEEKGKNIHVIFQKEIPWKKADKIIDHISKTMNTENITFSTCLDDLSISELF